MTSIEGSFSVALYVDGVPTREWDIGGLKVGESYSTKYEPVGALAAGVHSVRLVIDELDFVGEESEIDNIMERSFSVVAPRPQPTSTPIPTPTTQPTPTPQQVTSGIINSKLQDLNVRVGDTVIWINRDVVLHSSTSGQNAVFDGTGWDSQDLGQNDFFQWTFVTAGTFAYTCRFHSFMNATVTVGQ